MNIGLTSGVFDLVHVGHLHYLERCRALCDKLIVGVDCDALVKRAKGSERPFIAELQRLQLVQSLSCVDSAFLVREIEDLDRMAQAFNVTSLFKHDGWAKRDDIVGLQHGAKLVIVPDVAGLVSTTEIVSKIRGHWPTINGPRYEEGDKIIYFAHDGEKHEAVLRRVTPIMHDCTGGYDDVICEHRIWAAVWQTRPGVDHVCPIGRDWGRVKRLEDRTERKDVS